MLLPVGEVEHAVRQALRRALVAEDGVHWQTQLLVEAELRGHPSHGVLRLPRIIERINNGVADPAATGRHAWNGSATLAVDGEMGLGPVVAMSAIEEIGKRATETGVAAACLRNCNHLGMLAFYVEHICRNGQIAVAMTTSEALVHPWGGTKAMLGTNPLAIAVPAEPDPFVLDMATGVVSMGRIHDFAARGQKLEPGWAVDGDGAPTTDPQRAKSGAIAPFGGAKGYGLALAIEVLVGALTASALGREVRGTLDSTEWCTKGDMFLVFDLKNHPEAAQTIGTYLDAVRMSPSADGGELLVPGDGARRRRSERRERGIEVTDELWQIIGDLAQ